MADLPGTLGYLTVTGRGVLALGDSNDVGNQPDQVTALARIVFEPAFNVDVLTSLPDDMFVFAQKVTCIFNSDGRLVPPADGVSSPPDPAAPTYVSLIAPNQASLSSQGWDWVASFNPIAPQTWAPFKRVFTGAPGDVISLAQVIRTQPNPGVLQALVFDVATTAEPFPTGYRIGIDLLLTPDNKLWSTSA